eukprot:TRINITY_DN12071_c0_g1_i2.p1 TRINITY_DN12071_c0_g1~~TRINITY_DN12071_c0_g1_i2.p1  ORF type:complete len:801 (+),score=132.93 TRINITY_DN12071_c0_g1_i2:67-2403(+)
MELCGSSAMTRRRLTSDAISNALRFDQRHDHWVHERPHSLNEAIHNSVPASRADWPKRWRVWLLVLLVSVLAAALTFGCASLSAAVLRFSCTSLSSRSGAGGFLEWFAEHDCLWRLLWQPSLALASYGAAVVVTRGGGRDLEQFIGGSGIPELKCELGGVHLLGLFDWRVLVAKLGGLALASGAGLPVGMEGPFVHASACLSHVAMVSVPLFRPLLHVPKLRQMVLTAMVAIGVACTFTAPLGGVLFALEVTDMFASSAYLHCFFGATVAGFVNVMLRYVVPKDSVFAIKPLFDSSISDLGYNDLEALGMLIWCTVLGMICGTLGAGLVHAHRLVVRYVGRVVTSSKTIPAPRAEIFAAHSPRASPMHSSASMAMQSEESFISVLLNLDDEDEDVDMAPCTTEAHRLQRRRRLWRYALLVAVVAAANTLMNWGIPVLRNIGSQNNLLGVMTSSKRIDWGPHPLLQMAACLLVKFATTVVAFSLPLPMGSVAPSFVLGSLVGRLFGEMIEPLCGLGDDFCRGRGDEFVARCALVGASAFVAGSCRSFAQVIVVFERVGKPWMLLPLCASSLSAIFVSNFIGPSIFDSIIDMKRLPYLPSLAKGSQALTAYDVMRSDIPIITPETSASELEIIVGRHESWLYEVPVVARLATGPGPGQRERMVLLSALRSLPVAREVHRVGLESSASAADEAIAARNCGVGAISVAHMSEVDAKDDVEVAKGFLDDAVIPLQVTSCTSLRTLLQLMQSLDKKVAFVTCDMELIGAVTLSDLYSRACRRSG